MVKQNIIVFVIKKNPGECSTLFKTINFMNAKKKTLNTQEMWHSAMLNEW